jgi:hypothetical protein
MTEHHENDFVATDDLLKLVEIMIQYHTSRAGEGDNEALLNALMMAIKHGLPLPVEARRMILDRFQRYYLFEVRTLDEAFGVSKPKGFRLKDRRRRNKARFPVIKKVRILIEQGEPIAPDLFDRVAEEVNERLTGELQISGTVAAELWYEHKKYG